MISLLLVHYLVVLQKVLPDSVVVELDLLLRLFDGSGKHLVLNLLPIRNAQSIEDGHQFLRSEQAKQIILQRQVKTGFSRIPLTSGTSTELIVDPPGLMPLGADDLQASGLLALSSSLISVPRPAMLVAIVTAPCCPASETI